MLEEYKELSANIVNAAEKVIQEKEDAIHIGKIDSDIYEAKIVSLKNLIEANEREIREKYAEPERKTIIQDVSDNIRELSDLISLANQKINAHNKLVEDRGIEKTKLKDDIWATCLSEERHLIQRYQEEIKKIDKAEEGIIRARDDRKEKAQKLGKISKRKG